MSRIAFTTSTSSSPHAGVGAVVLYSLFEEQLHRQAAENALLVDAGTESFAESLSYFPAAAEDEAARANI